MKNITTLLIVLFFSYSAQAQYFQATMENNQNELIFKLRANPDGGDVTIQWTDIEFFVRWPENTSTFTFGEMEINTLHFPDVILTNNGKQIQGSEEGYINNWFGSSFDATAPSTFIAGEEYEVFRIGVNSGDDIPFELVHNTTFAPHYLALNDHIGNDLTNPSGNKFYGSKAEICHENCPISTNGINHIDSGVSASTSNVEDAQNLVQSIYPNPTSDYVILEGLSDDSSYILFDQKGDQVMNGKIMKGENKLLLENFASGVYYVKVYNDVESAVFNLAVIK